MSKHNYCQTCNVILDGHDVTLCGYPDCPQNQLPVHCQHCGEPPAACQCKHETDYSQDIVQQHYLTEQQAKELKQSEIF